MKKTIMITCAAVVPLLLCALVYLAVSGPSGGQPGQPPARVPTITEARAREIAQADAKRAYPDLSGYEVSATLQPDGWHVEYKLKDPSSQGGGPHYLINPQDGTMVRKDYEQ